MKIVRVEKNIVINKPVKEVFDFITNGKNDPLWRSEVDKMDVKGPVELGTIWVEYSTFFKFFHTVTTTKIVELDAPYKAVFETVKDEVWLKSTRTFKELSNNKTMFNYVLEYDKKLLKKITPILPTTKSVEKSYGKIVDKYLLKVKELIELQK